MDSNGLDRDVLLRAFSEQSDEGFAEMEAALVALEADPGNDEVLHSIFRVCHTLKGDAVSLGFQDLAEFAHVLEELLACLREGVTLPSRELVSLLLQGTDALRELVEDALQGREGMQPHHETLLQELQASAAPDPEDPQRLASGPPGGRRETARATGSGRWSTGTGAAPRPFACASIRSIAC